MRCTLKKPRKGPEENFSKACGESFTYLCGRKRLIRWRTLLGLIGGSWRIIWMEIFLLSMSHRSNRPPMKHDGPWPIPVKNFGVYQRRISLLLRSKGKWQRKRRYPNRDSTRTSHHFSLTNLSLRDKLKDIFINLLVLPGCWNVWVSPEKSSLELTESLGRLSASYNRVIVFIRPSITPVMRL